jgi:cytochrome b
MAFCFAGAYLTAEMDAWRQVHVTLGYTMAALVCFRIVWGFAGTDYARFSSFVRGPRATLSYLRSMFSGRPQHFTGHNPAGDRHRLGRFRLVVIHRADRPMDGRRP